MNYKLKSAGMLLLEFLVIWYGMGMPIPANITEAIKILIAMVVTFYTGWKNHDFSEEMHTHTLLGRQDKKLGKQAVPTVDEPDDSEVIEND